MQKFNDAPQQALGFLIAQTTHIESQVWEVKYPDILYPQFVPVDTSANQWAKTVTYFSVDKTGKAAWINGRSRDIPLADINRQKHETEVSMAGIGYDYSLEELNQARMLGHDLTADKAKSARRAYEEMVEDIAFVGDADKGFQGLLNNSTVSRADVANGVSTTPQWTTKTPDEILVDINAALSGVWIASKTVEMADTLLLPLAQYSLLATKRMASDVSTTILTWIEQNNIYTKVTGQKLMIRAMRQLTTAGNGGTARMVAYRRAPDVLKLHIPMPLQFLAPQQDVFTFLVPGMFRLGGVDIRLPGAVRYYDAI